MMKKKTILFAIAIALHCFAAIKAHHVVCIDSSLLRLKRTDEEKIKCTYNYMYKTRDGYHCYINFATTYGISIVTQESLEPGELGSTAVKSDIFGVPNKHKEISHKKGSAATYVPQAYTASEYGIPMAIKFKPFIMSPTGVDRLLYRNGRGEKNLPLLDNSGKGNDLQSLVGPGIKADTIDDLIYKLNQVKISHCSPDLSK